VSNATYHKTRTSRWLSQMKRQVLHELATRVGGRINLSQSVTTGMGEEVRWSRGTTPSRSRLAFLPFSSVTSPPISLWLRSAHTTRVS